MKWIIILLALYSCTMKTQLSTHQISIHDIYVLVSVDGQKVKGKLNKQSTLEINLTKMQMMGNDGCNEFGGRIMNHDSEKMELAFGEITSTEMYCDELSNKVGNAFYKVKKYKREDMLLQLLSDKDAVLLIYKKVD